MVIGVAAAGPHTDAVAVLLDPLLVGRGKPPAGAGWQGQEGASAFRAYVVLYPMTGDPDGNVAQPYEYLDYTVQATCVAATQDGAIALMDLVKVRLIGVRLAVAGRASYLGRKTLDQPARRDDAVAPALHYAVAQFSWRTQPA